MEIFVAEYLALVSETGDIMIPSAQPQIDQEMRQLYYPTEPPGHQGIRDYYPLNSAVLSTDGTHIDLNGSGSPLQVTTANGTTVEFHYLPDSLTAEGSSWPVVEKCTVVAKTNEAQSREYILLSAPGQIANNNRSLADAAIPSAPGDDSTPTTSGHEVRIDRQFRSAQNGRETSRPGHPDN